MGDAEDPTVRIPGAEPDSGPVTATFTGGADEPPPSLPERWQLVTCVGSGGQATVWLAEDRVLGQQVALQVFRPGTRRDGHHRWVREVRFGRELRHPHLIRLFDLVETESAAVAVMEWVAGGNLGHKVALEGPQPIDEVVRWARQALDALGYLHARKIVHRDVKPSNLLLDDSGDLRLADLGLVRPIDDPDEATRTGTGVGTPSFMAPEQLRGGPPSAGWDLYALGVSLYQMLTGRRPFAGVSEVETYDAQLHRRPTPVRRLRRECPRWLARFVMRLLELRPEDRWPSAAEALVAFDRRRAGVAPAATRRRLLTAAAGVVVTVGAVFGLRAIVAGGGDVAQVVTVDGRTEARDGEGRVLWSRDHPGMRVLTVTGELSPIRGIETALLRSRPAELSIASDAPVELEVVSATGDAIWSEVFGEVDLNWYPRLSPDRWATFPQVADVDGDGLDEVVFGTSHPLWYPTEIHVVGVGGDDHFMAVNSGHLNDLKTADLDGDGVLEVVALAINNPLGFQVALVVTSPFDRRTGERCRTVVSPDLADTREGQTSGSGGCLSYTLLGPRWSNPEVEVDAQARTLVVRKGAERVVFDRFANRIGGPLEGAGPGPLHRFWRDLGDASARLRFDPLTAPRWHDEIEALARHHPELLDDAPHLTAVALMLGAALAEGGRHDAAAELLEQYANELEDQLDLWLRAGEQRLIAGEREVGRRLVRRSLPVLADGRNIYDPIVVLAFDAAVFGDDDDVEATVELVSGTVTHRGEAFRETVHQIDLFFAGRFDDPRLGRTTHGRLMPWLPVISAWAELERTGDAETAVEKGRKLAGSAEAREIAILLTATAELRRGATGTALAAAEEAASALERRGRSSFEAFAWLPLARLVRAECRLAAVRGSVDPAELRWIAERSARTFVGRHARAMLAELVEEAGEVGGERRLE